MNEGKTRETLINFFCSWEKHFTFVIESIFFLFCHNVIIAIELKQLITFVIFIYILSVVIKY